MVNNTVNNKKEISEMAAGIGDKTKIAAVAWQNNRPQKLEIEVTNGKEAKNLPFMIENGDLIVNTDVAVVIKAEDNQKGKNQRKDNDEITH